MRFLLLTVSLSFSIYGSTFEECTRSVETVDHFFTGTAFSNYLVRNDVFSVLGRIKDTMEINFIDGKDAVVSYVKIQDLATTSTVFARDKNLTPNLRDIIVSNYFAGQVEPTLYCINNSRLTICCIYTEMQSKRHAVSQDEELLPLAKRPVYKGYNFDVSVMISPVLGFTHGFARHPSK